MTVASLEMNVLACKCFSPCFCSCRNPVPLKRPGTGVKQQRRDSPGLQHRGAGARGQANPKPERPGFKDARGVKNKDDKVGLQVYCQCSWINITIAGEITDRLCVFNP